MHNLIRFIAVPATVFCGSLLIPFNTFAASCSATADTWEDGYSLTVTVNSEDSTLENWQVSLDFTQAPNIVNSWNANVSASGDQVTASNLDWNGHIAEGESTAFGIQGTTSGSFTVPTCSINGNSTPPPTPTPTPTPSSGGPDGYTLCAQEDETCSFSGTRKIAYGANGTFNYKTATSNIQCSNDIFGDPLEGVAKACYYGPTDSGNDAEIIIQENETGFCHVDGAIENDGTGYTGNGYANTENASGNQVTWSINAETAGSYTLEWRYSSASENSRPATVKLDSAQGSVNFPTTGSWNTWTVETTTVQLQSGINEISLVANSAEGLPNIDSLKVIGSGISPANCDGSSSGGNPDDGGSTGSCPVELIGWATADGGTTGGGNATPHRVTSMSDLRTYAGDSKPTVVEISGTLSTGDTALEINSNTTLIGVDKNATIKGGVNMKGKSNIIIRNLNILGAGYGGKPVDSIAARTTHNIWFDHLNVTDGPDGILDLTIGSDHATVSWSKFSYTKSSHPHRLALLFGGSSNATDTDTGKNNHTVHHNWFGNLVDQRMPRLLFGKGHIFNNYYNSPGNSYCIGSGSWSSLLVENNYFKDVKSPHQFQDTNPSYITARGNIYDNTSGKKDTGAGGSGSNPPGAWTNPPYTYKLDAAADVPALVQRCAGPQ